MSQSRSESAVEAVVGTFVGMLVSLVIQYALFPYYGFDASLTVHLTILFWFTAASILRGYIVRRVFNARAWKSLFMESAA